MRHRARRFVALLLAFFFAHLAWAGDGAACTSVTARSATGSTASTGDMSGMGAMRMPGSSDSRASATGTSSGTSHRPASNDGCSRTSTPACQAMAPCAPMVLAAPPEFATAATRVATLANVLVVLTPSSRSTAPESPPPRA